jgi:hypothetical protein
LAIFCLAAAPRPAAAGLPGYFEWILWKQVKTVSEAKLEWVVGPYPSLSECEQERDRLARAAADTAVRFFCAPDSVNPRVDRRWP